MRVHLSLALGERVAAGRENVQTLVDRQNACLHLKCRNSIKHAAISPGRSWEFSSKLGLVSQSLQRLSYHFAHIADIEFD